MSINWVKQKISFVDSTQNPFVKKKSILEPRIVIVNAYTLIAVVYCASSAILFYYVVENIFLAIVHLLALLGIVTNYLILIQTKNFNRATNIILTIGTIVVVSLFGTGGWANTGFLWPFAYLPFAFFLSDRNVVINWVAALFGGCLLVVLLHFTGAITVAYSPAALVNYFAALLVFTVCIFLFQKATVKREEFLSYTETLLEAAPDAVIVIDDEGRIMKWNQKSETLFGWNADEVLGKLLSEIIIPNRYRTAHQKGLKYFLETGEGPVLDKTIEIQAINKKNIEFDVALSISPTIVNKKHLFIGFIRDIREKKEAEEKTKENENVFSTLFYKSPVMKAIAEASTGKYIDVNDAFADFLERTKEELLGKTSLQLNMIVNPGERDQTLKKIQKDGFARDVETQVTTKDGRTRWVSTNIDRMNLSGKDCFMTAAVDITKRKVAEENLLKLSQELEQKVLERTEEINRSEKKYRNLFENNPMPMWVFDLATFKFLDVNEAAISHYGYSRREFLSMTALDIRSDEDKERFKKLDHAADGRAIDPNRGIWKHLKKDGTMIYVDIIVHEIFFEGKPARLVLSNDVTERMKMEEMLKESYKETSDYKFAIDESSIVAITDQKGIIKHANDNFCKISRYSREELIGQDHRIINSGHHSKEFIRHLWLTIANGKIWKGELKNKAKDGSTYWVDTTIVPFLNENEKPYQYVAIRADITERKKLEEQQVLFASIVNSSDDAIITKTLDGKITSWNHGAEKVFGYLSKEIIGKHISILIPSHLQNEEIEIIEKVRNGEVVDHYETRRVRKDGKVIPVSLTISPIRDSFGNIIGASKISHDITEQKIAEENLQKSLREVSDYKYALDESSIVAITDQKGIIKYVNNNFCRISKYPAEELIGQDHRIINSGYHPKEFIRKLWVTIATGKIWRGELKNKAKDGTIYWVDTTIIPFLNEQGKPYQYIAMRADITERKQTEQRFHESQELLSAIIDNSTAVIYVKNLQGQYLLVNRRFAELFHRSQEGILGKTDYDFFSKEEADAFRQMDMRTVAAGHALTEEEIAPHDDGPHTYISVKSTLRNETGEPYAIFGISTDITELKAIEENLSKSLREISDYKYALDESSIVAITDQKGIIKYVNNNFCRISKYSAEELLGQDHRIINSGHHSKDFIRNLWVTIANGKIWRGELKNKAKDGTIYWVDTTIVPFLNEEGKPYQYVAIRADITGRKLAEEENRKLNEDLELRVKQRTEEMEAFSYSISHDLRSPLRAVNGYAKMLEEDYNKLFDDEGRRLLKVVQENAKKMGLLIDDLLAFSRLGRKEIYKTNVNMKLLTENVLDELNKSIHCNGEIKINDLHSAKADNTLMNQVMTNLLSNAIKYSFNTDKPVIEIKSEKKNGDVIYAVSDNGAGFDMQYVHKLFGVFQRLHAEEEFEGTGVGLAIVHRIITKHGGKVWAKGEIGKGATFYFSLPS